MEVREVGSSGLKLSVVGFGCWQLGQKGEADYWGTEVSQVTANELVKQAFESGVSCSIMHTTTRVCLHVLHPALPQLCPLPTLARCPVACSGECTRTLTSDSFIARVCITWLQ